MSQPIVFVSHFRVKEGKLEGARRPWQEASRRLEEEKPRTLVFLGYLDRDGTHVTMVHVFADADSMDLHVEGAGERSTAAYEFVEPEGFEIYGTPSDRVLEMLRREAATAGVTLTHQPENLVGFLRVKSG